jgi:glycerol kinase
VANNLLMQFQADVIGVRVVRPKLTETTAMGAAYLAGLAVGFWKSVEEIGRQWKVDRSFEPDGRVDAGGLISGWEKAVNACMTWSK